MNNAEMLKTGCMHYLNSCKLILLFALLMVSYSTHAQRNLTLFGLGDVNQLHELNPGFIPDGEIFVGIPIISNFNVQYSNDAFNLNQFGLASGDIRKSSYSKARPFTEPLNQAYGYATINLGSVGLRKGENLFTLSLTDHIDAYMQFPFSLIDLIADGEIEDTRMAKAYDLTDWSFAGSYYRALNLGFARQINERLSAGAQVKLLGGLSNIRTENTGLNFQSLNNDFVFYEAFNQLDMYGSGLDMFQEGQGVRPLVAGNYGFAFSLGGTYQVNEKLQLQASVLDLGFLKWNSELSMATLDQNDVYNEELGPFLQQTYDAAKDTLVYAQRSSVGAYRTGLSTKVYAAFQYHINKEHSFGGVINPIFHKNYTNVAASLSYRMTVSDKVRWSVNYAAYNGSYLNIGAGASFRVSNLQLYLASDNLMSVLVPGATSNIHVNFGANIVFGREKQQKELAEKEKAERAAKRLAKAEAAGEATGGMDDETETAGELADGADPIDEAELDPRLSLIRINMQESSSSRTLEEAAYIDVYKIVGAGQRELVRTERFPNGKIEFRLNRNEDPHEMKITAYGYKTVLYRFTPNTGQITENIPTIKESTQPEETKTPVATEEATAATSGEYPTEEVTETSTEVEALPEDKVYVLTGRTSFRKEASSTATVLSRFNVGDAVTVLEETNQWWWKVAFKGQTGWVKKSLLEPVE